MLTIDSQLAIDTILMTSKQPVDVLEIRDKNAKQNSIPDEGSQVIKLFKFNSPDQKRITLLIRAPEGLLGGNISFYVVPQETSDTNTCTVIEVPLKPLNQHERISSIPADLVDQLPWSSLRIAGNFSHSEGISWVSNCLPNISQSASDAGPKTVLSFKSCFTQTYLIIEVESRLILVKSDNLSAITIVKDQLTLDANNRKLAIDVQSDLNEQSIPHILGILHPLVVRQLDIARKFNLIDAIKEMITGEEDTSFLSQEYKDILRDEEVIKQCFID